MLSGLLASSYSSGKMSPKGYLLSFGSHFTFLSYRSSRPLLPLEQKRMNNYVAFNLAHLFLNNQTHGLAIVSPGHKGKIYSSCKEITGPRTSQINILCTTDNVILYRAIFLAISILYLKLFGWS